MYLYTKVVVSHLIMGEEVPNSYEEVPIAINPNHVMAFYRRIEEPGEVGKCEMRCSTIIMKDGTEYYTPLTFEQVKTFLDPQGNDGGLSVSNDSPYSPTTLTPGI